MKRVLHLLTIFIFLFSVAQTEVYAQTQAKNKNRRLIKADNTFNLEQYVLAAELYAKAYKKTKDNTVKARIIFKQGECYRLSGNYKVAAAYYEIAIKVKYDNAIVYLHYADMLRIQEDYAEAQLQYTKYMQLNPTDVRGQVGLRSCEFSLKWKDRPTRYKVELMTFVNSPYSDYSPAFGSDEYTEMYFTSSRPGGLTDEEDQGTGQPFTDIYFTKMNMKGAWSAPEVDPINTKGNEGSVVLNSKGTVMYLTQCPVERKKSSPCRIYVSKRSGKLWGNPELVQITLDSNITIGHPALSPDESKLIFSAEMPFGVGGKDLWMVHREKRNKWSDPVNLGSMVNTSGNEVFPFWHADGTIYFSSDGHMGMGGLDVFKTSLDENYAYISPINLKCPINSSADDFGMIIEKEGERGYLTSSRGKRGDDNIYQFELPPIVFSVKGVVTDSKTGRDLPNIKVQLIGNDGNTKAVVTDNSGAYQFPLKPLTSYEIIVNTKGYLKKSANETTVGIENNKVFFINLVIDPVKKEIPLPLIEYDLAKWDLRPASKVALNNLAEGLLDNSNVVIELKSHTDELGANNANLGLSQKRGNSCIEYLINQGVDPGQLIASGMGESEPFVIEEKNGRFKVGDVLTERYISKIIFKKRKEIAHQYNRRTSFKVVREDYIPVIAEKK